MRRQGLNCLVYKNRKTPRAALQWADIAIAVDGCNARVVKNRMVFADKDKEFSVLNISDYLRLQGFKYKSMFI